MTFLTRIRHFFRPKPESQEARAERKLSEDHLRDLKISQQGAGSMPGGGAAAGQIDAARRGGRY